MGETSSLSHIKSTLTESPSIVSNRRLDSAPSNEWTRRVVEVEEKKRLIHDDKAQAQAQAQAHDKPAASLLLLNLPVDPLHCIAGFLTCSEWADFGKTSHAANRACREIFKRVKLHGFRCAAEVISAWKKGQPSDARELCALYIQSGVPIYPQVLGHSYDTLIWRMDQALELESQLPHQHHNDTFYTHKDSARAEGYYDRDMTFAEEKSWYYHSNNSTDTANKMAKLTNRTIPLHRHLLDQHMRACQATPPEPMAPFQLAADFFHNLSSSMTAQQQSSTSSLTLLPGISLEAYSCATLELQFTHFHQRLEALLDNQYDTLTFDETLLDFWDEHFPSTKGVWLYDQSTPVPRPSSLNTFLTTPCPQHWGTIQCEIERIRKKKKKSPFMFPIYDYRLFIRDRRFSPVESARQEDPSLPPRQDTLLMVAQNKAGNKRGSNSYHLYLPQPADIQSHFRSVNSESKIRTMNTTAQNTLPPHQELGRLQSNFIGTEFQIFTPTSPKHHNEKKNNNNNNTNTINKTQMEKNKAWSKRFSRRSNLKNKTTDSSDASFSTHATGINSNSDARRWSVKSRNGRKVIADSSSQEQQYEMEEIECGAITYTANLLGNRPRIMDVCIPKVESSGMVSDIWRRHVQQIFAETALVESMLQRFKQIQYVHQHHPDPDFLTQDVATLGLMALQNRPPWWNVDLGAFVLNFGGRVSVASVKNFQLCDKNNQEHIMLQFGRISGRHSFTMDFQYPLSPVQAFAIAISSLQSKLSFG